MPTTVVHGSEDPLIPVRNGMRIAQLVPGARYVELPGVGHLVAYEAPDASPIVADVLTSWGRHGSADRADAVGAAVPALGSSVARR